MRRMIRAEFPGHGIQGEEFAAEAGADFTWVLDPIDGTKSFISGYPLFGALIALTYNGRAVLGVIEAPALGERWVGLDGAATVCNGATVHASACTTIEQARVYSTTTDAFEGERLQRYDAFSRRAAIRRFGGDCYLYGLLAAGHCDLVIEAAMKPHDFQALVPVVEGAGGKISDWSGRPLGNRLVGGVERQVALFPRAAAARRHELVRGLHRHLRRHRRSAQKRR